MSDVFNVLMAGVGGQGIVLASDILAEAALRKGMDVKKSEIHGMAVRGGPVFSHVRFGERVHAPVISEGEADILFALESMEVLRWAKWASEDCVACYLSHNISPEGADAYPEGVEEEIARLFKKVVKIEPATLKQRLSSLKVENTALLGALSALTPIEEAHFLEALSKLSPEGTFELNQRAFEVGKELAAQPCQKKQESEHVE